MNVLRNTFLTVMLLSGCAADSQPEEIILPPLPPTPQQMPIIKASVDKPAPSQQEPGAILIAAAQAKTDATGYVAWKKSKPENIERLTTLTLNLDTAIHKMQTSKSGNHYAPGTVAAAREALKDLQSFLQNKGD